MTVEIKILFGFQCVGMRMLRLRLNTFGDVSEDFLCSKHAIGVEAGVTIM